MKVTFIGELKINRFVNVLNEVFDNMTQDEIDHMRNTYTTKHMSQNEENHNKKLIKLG